MPGTFPLLIIQLCEWTHRGRSGSLPAGCERSGYQAWPWTTGRWSTNFVNFPKWKLDTGMSQALGQLGSLQFSPELARPPHALATRTPIGEPPFFFSHPGFSTSSLMVRYSKRWQFGGHYYIFKATSSWFANRYHCPAALVSFVRSPGCNKALRRVGAGSGHGQKPSLASAGVYRA